MYIDKRQLYHIWMKLRGIKPWYFLVVALISGMICIVALRQNNLQMAKLRSAVYTADKSGSNVQQALQKLQIYVTSHMNTELSAGPNAPYPPIQLQYTYDRAVQAAGNTASAANAMIYTNAQHYCEATVPNGFSGSYRISCIQAYVDQHGVKLPTIPDSLYKFSFLSPVWSPDVAGWSMLVTIITFALFVALYTIQRWLHNKAK